MVKPVVPADATHHPIQDMTTECMTTISVSRCSMLCAVGIGISKGVSYPTSQCNKSNKSFYKQHSSSHGNRLRARAYCGRVWCS
ncbi:unnamed protein product [Prunus armeniaca]|uniref:Uncharacterized protein n=1 Tax=Prunus armeniaca TaxID=36596 RepID=A0A6J5Y271_PRUAR|nr:unnamed protein product [Prunus armeniaca]